jgi:hypothetical protein
MGGAVNAGHRIILQLKLMADPPKMQGVVLIVSGDEGVLVRSLRQKCERENPYFIGPYDSNMEAFGLKGFEIENQFQFWIVRETFARCQQILSLE